jgi:fumarate reductase flavoprotein subunit
MESVGMTTNDINVDVAVVGGGGSGLAAAAEAAQLGHSVILVEKESELGGSTA